MGGHAWWGQEVKELWRNYARILTIIIRRGINAMLELLRGLNTLQYLFIEFKHSSVSGAKDYSFLKGINVITIDNIAKSA
jgi:hypothetical protein